MGKNSNRSNGKKQDSAGRKIEKASSSTKDRVKAKPAKSQDTEKELRKRQRIAVVSLLQKLESARQAPVKEPEIAVEYYIGIDLGDKRSSYCFLDKNGAIAAEGSLATTTTDFTALFKAIPRCRIALEVGTHSPWVSALLEEIGHEVFVANPRKMGGEKKKNRRKKNDRLDAETLARLLKSDPRLLYPIRHRGEKARRALVLLRARQALVRARTRLICATRGMVKSDGYRLPSCSAKSFHKMPRTHVPEALQPTLEPLFEQIGNLTGEIKKYEAAVLQMCRHAYPETELLQQVDGVGPITSLGYLLTIEDPKRFEKSRDAGAYVGLVPRQYDSGDSRPQLRITKTGDRMLRELLVECAQHMLSRHGKDSDLRRHGLKLAARGAKNGKKRAIVAVARKTAVLLHRLWLTGEVYEPLHNSLRKEQAA